MATPNSKSQQQDQQQQQQQPATTTNTSNGNTGNWTFDAARSNQPLSGGVSAANFNLSNDTGNIGRSNVMDALMIARLQQQSQDQQQQQQQQQQQHDTLRRLSIDTIGSSHRSAGLDGANGLMSATGRLNTNNLIQQAHTLQQQQYLLSNNNQFFSPQQMELQNQLQQAGMGGGNGMGGGLYPRSDSLSYMQNFDPSSAAVANLRLQQGFAGMGSSGLNAGSNLSQSLLAHNLLPGNNIDFANSGANPMLDVDFLYRALLQQQQQKQQADSFLNLQLNQQQMMSSFGNDPNSRSDLPGGNSAGMTGLDGMTQQHRFQHPNAPQAGRSLGGDQLDWSRNSESNIDSTTLLSLQQQQQQLQQQQQQISEMNHINYPSAQNNQMMNFEEQLAMNSSMWNHPSSMLNLQQQNQIFSQQFHGVGGNNLDGEMAGGGGIGSNSLLTALFAESGQGTPFDLGGLQVNAAAGLNNLTMNGDNAAAVAAAAAVAKSSKAPPESTSQLPIRALSAYNFFFRDERERIINCGDGDDPLDPTSLKAKRNAVSFNEEKKKQLLSGHWFRDRTAKRRHRKTHGKIAFTALSKVIAQAWRDLPESEKAFYRDVAADDLDRYQRELEEFKVVDGVDPKAAVGPNHGPDTNNAGASDESGREPV